MKRLFLLSGSLLIIAGCTSTQSPDVISQINQEISAQPPAAGAEPFLSEPSGKRWARGLTIYNWKKYFFVFGLYSSKRVRKKL